jgi:hypothetical protein
MVIGKKDFGKVDLTTWYFPDLDMRKLTKSVSDVLRYVFNQSPPYFHMDYFNFMYGLKGSVKICVIIPVADSEDGVQYSTTLKSLVDEIIKEMSNAVTGKIEEEEFSKIARHIVKDLIANAKRLERSIKQ